MNFTCKYLDYVIGGTIVWCSLVLGISNTFAGERKFTVFTEEWAPYNYSEHGLLKGISVEVVQQLMRQIDATPDFVVLPGMRATAAMAKTPGSMFISLFRTQEREEKYHWVGPIISSSVYFYKRAGSRLDIKTLEDAKRVERVASRHAGLVHRMLKREGFTNLDDTAKNAREVYRKLLAGRSDLGISDSPLGVKYVLEQLGHPVTALTQTPVKILDMDLYIAVHKSVSKEQVDKLQAALETLKQSVHYDEIVKKYSE